MGRHGAYVRRFSFFHKILEQMLKYFIMSAYLNNCSNIQISVYTSVVGRLLCFSLVALVTGYCCCLLKLKAKSACRVRVGCCRKEMVMVAEVVSCKLKLQAVSAVLRA